MKKEIAHQLLVEYEDIILEFSRKMLWLIKQGHGKRYMFAVHKSMHDKTIEKLEKVHEKLLSFSKISLKKSQKQLKKHWTFH